MSLASEQANATARLRTGIAIALLLFSCDTRAQTQEPENPPSVTFRTGATLVVLDAVVKDSDGKPVTNLTKDDFTVVEDGVTQTIASFESAPSKDKPAPSIATRNSENELKLSHPVSPPALTILVLDELNSEVLDQALGRIRGRSRSLHGLP